MSKADVCAVMVTHNPGDRLSAVVDSFLSQVDRLVIVDNASGKSHLKTLEHLVEDYPERITLIANEENLWLAAALNQGVRWAQDHLYEYVLLMNDGNLLSPHAVQKMIELFQDPALGKVGTVNPRVIIGDRPEETVASPPVDERLPVTAGCLLSLEAALAVGEQREDFLVDMIDYDYGFRLHRSGYRTLQAPSVSVACELGRTTQRRFLWRRCNVENYSPIRRYYYARNGLTLIRETRDNTLIRSYFYFLAASMAKIVLYEDRKREKLSMTMIGLGDALRGRLGPHDSWV